MRGVARTATAALLCFSAVAHAASPDAGRPAKIDLDLHSPPMAAEPRPSPGAILAPPRSMSPPSPASRYQLRPASDGGYLYAGAAFDAHIAPDGAVTFSTHGAAFTRVGDVRAPGRDPTTSGESAAAGGGPGLRFDVTDEYLRRLRRDPTRDAKAAFLTGTFDLRLKLALAAREEVRQAALARLPERLNELWRDPRLTGRERQTILLRIWDTLGSENVRAREIVGDFARHHLPPAKAAAFR
jgi:hypothetical protein